MSLLIKGMDMPKLDENAEHLWVPGWIEVGKVVEFLMQRFIRMPTFNVNTETIYQKEYALFGQCPECGTELSSDFNFCSNCGQALDWS